MNHAPLISAFPYLMAMGLGLLAAPGCADQAREATPVPHDETTFGGPVAAGLIEHNPIREASGMVASRQNPGVLWVHNDSGDGPHLYALTTRGKHLGVYTIDGAQARDWEDMALGPGPDPGQDYLYIGDIGDNEAQHDLKYIYRVPEPRVDTTQTPRDTTLTGTDTITLRYPGGPADAETLLLDPLTKDLYVITKRNLTVQVYRITYPPSTTGPIEMERAGTLTLRQVPGASMGGQGAVAGDIAPSGLAVLIKSYDTVYYWQRADASAPLFGALPVTLPYTPEPQGEALAWAADGSGYYTLSEEARSVPAMLYFYPRLTESDRR